MALERMPDNGLNKKLLNNDELVKEVNALEEEILSLKVAYEQYFLGLEKHLPSKEHAELKRRILKLKGAFVRQTSIKFRINGVQQKFLTYERLWQRTLQQIEDGTYIRDLKKLQRKKATAPAPVKQEAEALPPAPPIAATQPGAPGVAPAVRPVTPGIAPVVPPVAPGMAARPGMPPPPPSAAIGAPRPAAPMAARPAGGPPPPPAAAAGGNLSDAKVKAIYDAYVQAKKNCKEDVSKLSMDTMAATLRKQVPDLLKKHNAKDVEFKVVIKDGKAVLRAVPK